MHAFKKILISLTIAAVSSVAFAAAKGEEQVAAAAEGTLAKIEEAVSLVEKGGSKEDIVKAINDARQLQKEFRYELTERQRQKANDKLRVARDAFEKGELQPAESKLREALANFTEMKAFYDANHK
jgi:DNA-binding transcriptional MerR regulator